MHAALPLISFHSYEDAAAILLLLILLMQIWLRNGLGERSNSEGEPSSFTRLSSCFTSPWCSWLWWWD